MQVLVEIHNHGNVGKDTYSWKCWKKYISMEVLVEVHNHGSVGRSTYSWESS